MTVTHSYKPPQNACTTSTIINSFSKHRCLSCLSSQTVQGVYGCLRGSVGICGVSAWCLWPCRLFGFCFPDQTTAVLTLHNWKAVVGRMKIFFRSFQNMFTSRVASIEMNASNMRRVVQAQAFQKYLNFNKKIKALLCSVPVENGVDNMEGSEVSLPPCIPDCPTAPNLDEVKLFFHLMAPLLSRCCRLGVGLTRLRTATILALKK